MRVGARGTEIPVVLTPDSQYRDMRPVTSDIHAAFWTTDGPHRVRAAIDAGTLPLLDVTGLRIGAPIAQPGVVLCIRMNYAAHAAETGAPPSCQLKAHPIPFKQCSHAILLRGMHSQDQQALRP